MRGKFLQRLWRQRGQTLVEFALILPVLMLVILGVIEFGRIFYGFSTLQNAARYGADVASKGPPHIDLLNPVPNDPEGRYYAVDPPDCGQSGKDPCFLAGIREAVRRYAVLFTPRDAHIHVYFVPVNGVVTNDIGGVIEVQIEYPILPITPIIKDLAPLGVPVTVDSRRTIVNLEFPYEVVTPGGTPWPTLGPTATPAPGCGGKYTFQNEVVNGNVYGFDITNNDTENHGIVGLMAGWCEDLGQLTSLTIGGVPMIGSPVDPPWISVPGGGIVLPLGQTMHIEMHFQNDLNQTEPSQWPSWYLTFDDYCSMWSTGRNCSYPTPTALPTQTPTSTPTPTSSPTPWPSGTVPPLCGMSISNGPIFAGDRVLVQVVNNGTSSPNLSTIVVFWGAGWRPLQQVQWGGQTIWTGTKYYSAFLSGLSGDFPAGTTRDLEFDFGDSPINWLSFQVVFDNNCFVSFSDPHQPTPPPLPTATPTPAPGWIYLALTDLNPNPPTCATTSFSARAIAYYPLAGYNDGNGIARVDFRILDSNNSQVYSRSDTSSWYCLGSGSGPCNPLSLGATWPGGSPIVSGTYTLEATAYTTSGWGNYQRTVSTQFRICREPLHLELGGFSYGPSPTCADKWVNAWAIAWDPQVCGDSCSDGQGISRVYFQITKDGQLVYQRYDTSVCYCAKPGNCTCPNIDFSNGNWVSDAGTIAVSNGTHVLTVQAVATSGRNASITRAFDVCWNPCTPYTWVSIARGSNYKQVILTIKNNGTNDRWVRLVHVANWPTGWGNLNSITVIGQTYTVNWTSPPHDLTCDNLLAAGQTKTVVFQFANNVTSNVSQLTGWLGLDNDCQISFQGP
jgi:hypothetical protein